MEISLPNTNLVPDRELFVILSHLTRPILQVWRQDLSSCAYLSQLIFSIGVYTELLLLLGLHS